MADLEQLERLLKRQMTVEVNIATHQDFRPVVAAIIGIANANTWDTKNKRVFRSQEGIRVFELAKRIVQTSLEVGLPIVEVSPHMEPDFLMELISQIRGEKERVKARPERPLGPILITKKLLRYRSDEIGRFVSMKWLRAERN